MSVIVDNSSLLLPALERARYFQQLLSQGISSSEIARQTGKSLAFVSNTLRLLRLPSLIQEGLVSDTISEGHARALLGLREPQKQLAVYREILVKGINVRETEKLVREMGN